MTSLRWLACGALVAGCTEDPEPNDTTDTAPTEAGCQYPDAEEPMALGEVLFPYRWLDARHRDGRRSEIRLRDVFCDTQEDIDWSPFDVLLFVSIPAW